MSNLEKRTYPHGQAVEPLYTEGPDTQPGFRKQPWWTMMQEHTVTKEFTANQWAHGRLQHGASGLLFYLTDQHYLPRILKDISLPHIELGLVVEGSGPEVMEALLHHAHGETTPAKDLRGFINIDPIEEAARTGVWNEAKMYELGELSRLTPEGMRFMCVNANFYGLCGASAATQLALAAAHLDFYLGQFGEVGYRQYWLALTSGTYLFEEMAKHRAARLLWARLLEEYELPPTHLEIYSETSAADQSVYDQHTNLLRATSAAFGAIVGGADAVHIRPYNACSVAEDPEAERLALNQHYLLAYESHLDRVEDPAAGSYFVEQLTSTLCEQAWSMLQTIRQQGGLLEALRAGWVQDLLDREVAAAQPEKVLGVNLYPNAKDTLPDAYIVKEPKSREAHKSAHADKEIEPLRPLRWAARAEFERASAQFPEA